VRRVIVSILAFLWLSWLPCHAGEETSDAGGSSQTQNGTSQDAAASSRTITGKDGAEMILVDEGEFMMGSPDGEGWQSERPHHKVFLDAYYIDKYEVTVKQYRKFCEATGKSMPRTPSFGWQDDHPVVNIMWNDAVAYATWAGKRLPTEAEWEKACRAGSETRYCYGDDAGNLGEYAWFSVNSGNRTHPVGQKKPNAWGLYDMHGNVCEWCSDWYEEGYYKSSPDRNPTGPENGRYRVLCGGSWYNRDLNCHSGIRGWLDPSNWLVNYGFRCVRSAGSE